MAQSQEVYREWKDWFSIIVFFIYISFSNDNIELYLGDLEYLIGSRDGSGMGFFGDGDFSFRARSKNPRGFEIPGMGIGDFGDGDRSKKPPLH